MTTDDDNTNYLAKPLDWCDLLLSQPLFVFKRHALSFLLIAFAASGLRALLSFIFDVANGPNYGADYGYETDYSTSSSVGDGDYTAYSNAGTSRSAMAGMYFMYYVNALILYIVATLVDGACIHLVAMLYAGQQSPPLQLQDDYDESPPKQQGSLQSLQQQAMTAVVAIGKAVEKILPLVGSCLVISGIMFVVLLFMAILFSPIIVASGQNAGGNMMVLTFAMLIFIFWISCATFLMYPAIMVEHASIRVSIERSYHLTKEYMWNILGLLLVYGLMKTGISIIIVAITVANTQAAFIIRGILIFGLNTFFLALMAM